MTEWEAQVIEDQAVEIKRLRASELAWKLMAKKELELHDEVLRLRAALALTTARVAELQAELANYISLAKVGL